MTPADTRDVWAEINARPSTLRPFGSALKPNECGGKMEPLPRIGPTLRLTRPEVRQPACPTCGNNGQFHCECPEGGKA